MSERSERRVSEVHAGTTMKPEPVQNRSHSPHLAAGRSCVLRQAQDEDPATAGVHLARRHPGSAPGAAPAPTPLALPSPGGRRRAPYPLISTGPRAAKPMPTSCPGRERRIDIRRHGKHLAEFGADHEFEIGRRHRSPCRAGREGCSGARRAGSRSGSAAPPAWPAPASCRARRASSRSRPAARRPVRSRPTRSRSRRCWPRR